MATAATPERGAVDLGAHGLSPSGEAHWNLTTAELCERALQAGAAQLTDGGALVVNTAPNTGRSPKDKFIVEEAGAKDRVWWGPVNRPLAPAHNARIREDLVAFLNDGDVYVLDAWAGAHPDHRVALRVVSKSAWHLLFAQTMLIPASADEIPSHDPEVVILHAPEFQADPEVHGTRVSGFVTIDFTAGEILIGGTRYAGEIKKSVFTIMNDRLPQKGILSMHCSANVGDDGNVAVFFGLSGTGKTTLSTDSERPLIGDDEHGWADDGVFNIEGGCYAKAINLSAEAEPEIHATTSMFGTIIENVVMDPTTRVIDFADGSITENTRVAYPLASIPGSVRTGRAGTPTAVVLLTADAFGVLPPVARLTPEQAMYHFLSGYTAKLAGTEVGVTEPQTTFSTCFGAPFLALDPGVYARMLGERLEATGASAWLVNTGWTGGPYGVGSRMPIAATRALVRAAVNGELDQVETVRDPIFGLHIPVAVPGVDSTLLNPVDTWDDAAAFETTGRRLAAQFVKNFEQYAGMVPASVLAAAPDPGDEVAPDFGAEG
ncbi:MAG: phosphoenolpyruvate carboxykinase (ATP) [Actinobacteria bacterium]|nr:phosphoenolpyruvate carboxykinase (ATP) [Actinomycetota bacterium]